MTDNRLTFTVRGKTDSDIWTEILKVVNAFFGEVEGIGISWLARPVIESINGVINLYEAEVEAWRKNDL